MHTVDTLHAAIQFARNLGIQVREDWLDGASGGECEIAGQRWIFLDLSQSPQERLQVVASCLMARPLASQVEMPPELQPLLQVRSAA
jgi:hypothetical protein